MLRIWDTCLKLQLGGAWVVRLTEGPGLTLLESQVLGRSLLLQDFMCLPKLRKACHLKSNQLRHKKKIRKSGTKVVTFLLGSYEYFRFGKMEKKTSKSLGCIKLTFCLSPFSHVFILAKVICSLFSLQVPIKIPLHRELGH